MIGERATRSTAEPNGPAVADPTPGLLLGPYYPLEMPAQTGSDVWDRDAPLPPDARRLRLEGTLVGLRRCPIAGATIEVWHADHEGRYRHPSAPDSARVPPGFSGCGRTHSDARGRFCFRTMVPGAYVAGQLRRAPHVHVQVTGRVDRLVTQMFLPGHPMNLADHWYLAVSRPEALTPQVVCEEADGTLVLAWTIVLAQG